jgi:hypothetical protein
VFVTLTLGAAGCGDSADQSTTSAPPASTAAATTTTPAPTSASSTTTPGPVADIEEFVLGLMADFQEADRDSLTGIVHPAVLQLYGADGCRAYVAGLVPATIGITPDHPEPVDVEVERDGHVLQLFGWILTLDEAGAALFPEGLLVAVDDQEALGWVPDCGRVLITADPGDLAIVTIGGDSRSVTFDAPDSWRVEAASNGPCEVILYDQTAGTSESVGSGDTSFVVQLGGTGRYSIEALGCTQVSVIENSAET